MLATKVGGERAQDLRKTCPAGHGLPFANARFTLDFGVMNKCVFLLFTMAYEILLVSMGC